MTYEITTNLVVIGYIILIIITILRSEVKK